MAYGTGGRCSVVDAVDHNQVLSLLVQGQLAELGFGGLLGLG